MAAPTRSGRPSSFGGAVATRGMALVIAYITVDVVLQLLPPHYSPVSDAESNLAVGPFGWVMNLNFLSRAAMTLCVLVAVSDIRPASPSRRIGSLLLGLAGLCSAALVFFPTDVNGSGEYGVAPTTLIGTVHVIFATVGFLLALAAMLLLTFWMREAPGLLGVRRAASVFVWLAAVGLAALALSIAFVPTVFGLAERICLAGILGWAFVVCRAAHLTHR